MSARNLAKPNSIWTFWEDEWDILPSGDKRQVLKLLADGETVKDFYILLNRHNVSGIPKNCSLHIFRNHVRPEWEDKHNINGGHFRVFAHIGADPQEATRRINCLWFDVVRSIVGEHLTHSCKVVGVGYTNKPYRQLISVWLSEVNEEVVNSVGMEILQLCGNFFSLKFMAHRDVARKDYTAQETMLHRRIKSAPENTHVLSVDDADLDQQETSSSSHFQPKSLPLQEQTVPPVQEGKESAEEAVFVVPEIAPSVKQRVVTQVLTRLPKENMRDHNRSRSESQQAEVFASQPIRPYAPKALGVSTESGRSIETFSSQGSAMAGFITAPTPVKDWTVGWSPSQFVAAQRSNLPFGSVALQQCVTASSSGATATVTSGPSANNNKSIPPPPPHERHHQTSPIQRKPLPPKPTPVGANVPVSDRKPFVCRGTVYPPGLNRKEYRAIVFNHEEHKDYPNSYPVDDSIPDGDVELSVYEHFQKRAEDRKVAQQAK